METNALITLSGVYDAEAEQETVEVTTMGRYIKKDDKYYVTYEGTELTGYENTTTTLKNKDGCISMIRFGYGPANTQMVFETNKTYLGVYSTPHGDMTVGITTRRMNVDIDDEGGEIDLDYLVELNHTMPIRNGLHVSIRKVGN